MIVFNCTKSAANYLFPKRLKGIEPTLHEIRPVPDFDIDYKGKKNSPVSQWMVTHRNLRGDNVLYVCHVNHRYVISLTGINKGDVETFLFIVHGRLMAQFACWAEQMPFSISLGINQWMENYFEVHQGIYFCQRWDPSIQASINRVSNELETDFEIFGRLPENQEEGTFFDIEKNLRYERPSKIKRNIIPTNELFCDFLTHYMGIQKKNIMKYRSAAEAFFKDTTISRLLSHTEYENKHEDDWNDPSYLEKIEAEYQALIEAGDVENAAVFEAFIRLKKLQNDQENK